jgi:hypothetical protein
MGILIGTKLNMMRHVQNVKERGRNAKFHGSNLIYSRQIVRKMGCGKSSRQVTDPKENE